MSWSLGETRALAVKAARGVGMSWGVAEDAGFAVQWLHANDLPGVTALQKLLTQHHRDGLDAGWISYASEHLTDNEYLHCPIALGLLVSDTCLANSPTALLVQQPLLLLPFLAGIEADPAQPDTASPSIASAGIALPHIALQVTFDDINIVVSNSGIHNPELPALMDTARCKWHPATPSQASTENRTIQSEEQRNRVSNSFAADIAALESFASLTYAPATEESRMRGAGAGLNDND